MGVGDLWFILLLIQITPVFFLPPNYENDKKNTN